MRRRPQTAFAVLSFLAFCGAGTLPAAAQAGPDEATGRLLVTVRDGAGSPDATKATVGAALAAGLPAQEHLLLVAGAMLLAMALATTRMLPRSLAATRGGTMAEFGTGCGVGTAWLRSGVRNGARILTAELDESLAGAASKIFDDDAKVEVLAADWSVLREHGPFSLLFLDSGTPSEVGVDAVIDLVEPGGIVVLDPDRLRAIAG